MNGEDPIEEALQKMRPAELPAHLMARLTAARPQAQKTERPAWPGVLLRWLLPVTAGACMAGATFLWLERDRSPAGSGSAPVARVALEQQAPPTESEDYFVGARPVGIVVAPNRRPYRVMEVEWIEHDTVRTGADGPALHTATRRRDVVPVALELY